MSAIRQVRIIDCQTVVIADENEDHDEARCDELLDLLRKSVQLKCKHKNAEVTTTSESGSNTAYIGYYCRDCKKSWRDEVTNAVYLRLLEDDYTETEKAS